MAPYRDLKERTARGESIFVTEGLLLTQRLLTSRFEAESVFVSEPFSADVERLAGPDVPVYVASEKVLQEIVGFPFHRGVLAVGRRGNPLLLDDLLWSVGVQSPLGLIVCPHVNQAENLGLIFRTAAAFGMDGVLLGPQSTDPFSRRCLRLSMGGSLRVPFVVSADLLRDLVRLKDRWKVELVATVVDARAEPLSHARWQSRTALLVGNEFEGLPSQHLAVCDRRLTIPMQPGTDSLNVGVAAGIFLYEWKKQASDPATTLATLT
ncbi:MAG: RNA methyltransferase [Pirellulales bacterium]|nr:RNA methyltransferase [Pirellulales bacterium]